MNYITSRGNSKYHYYGIRVKPGSSLSGAACQGEGGTSATKGRCGSGGATGGRAHARQDQLEQGTNSHMHQHHQVSLKINRNTHPTTFLHFHRLFMELSTRGYNPVGTSPKQMLSAGCSSPPFTYYTNTGHRRCVISNTIICINNLIFQFVKTPMNREVLNTMP